MRGDASTNERAVGAVSTGRRWAEYLISILAGNIAYLFIEPQLPLFLRHRLFRVDWGLGIDFLICAAVYGLALQFRGLGNGSN